MKNFFNGVRKHINRLDEDKLREQYILLSQELSKLDRIFDSMSEGIVFCDLQGSITYENKAVQNILGMSAAEAIAQLNIALDTPSKREISIAYPEQKYATIQVMPTDRGTSLIIHDNTAERIAAIRELESGAFNAVSTFASGLAHEIGNPLNALSMTIQLLESKVSDKEDIEICKQQIKRISDFSRNFLTALRPTKPNFTPGSVADPLKSCLASLKTILEDRRISVTLDIPAALPPIALDTMQMEHVFFNLIKNALEAMKDGSSLNIQITSDDHEITLSFRDNGLGMTQEQLAHLFEPYRTTKSTGNGLGLMICARIVHDHGGTISAESKPGEGSTFTIRLPRLEKRIRELK